MAASTLMALLTSNDAANQQQHTQDQRFSADDLAAAALPYSPPSLAAAVPTLPPSLGTPLPTCPPPPSMAAIAASAATAPAARAAALCLRFAPHQSQLQQRALQARRRAGLAAAALGCQELSWRLALVAQRLPPSLEDVPDDCCPASWRGRRGINGRPVVEDALTALAADLRPFSRRCSAVIGFDPAAAQTADEAVSSDSAVRRGRFMPGRDSQWVWQATEEEEALWQAQLQAQAQARAQLAAEEAQAGEAARQKCLAGYAAQQQEMAAILIQVRGLPYTGAG
ncbi:hypothetical protein V8C86DRAFT_1250922 [Haematococcus lacustris]